MDSLTIIWVLIALPNSNGLLVKQMYVKTSFWNRELDDEMCMDLPKQFMVEGKKIKDAWVIEVFALIKTST